MPSFSDFYRAINYREPFPWQDRLAKQVVQDRHWPEEIGIPTGLGKSACLDIAIWWLASQADLCPTERTAPTRIWWVVNRRLLVDSTYDHAQKISKALGDALNSDQASFGDALAQVGRRLCSLSAQSEAPPIEVIRLRGGVASDRPRDPSQPAIILSTLPMYGSRLLFRGYGSSRLMRPVDAALAGTDSLILLDEAHLVPHLRTLVPALAECMPKACDVLGGSRSRPVLVSLTATGDAKPDARFALNSDDEAKQVIRQRLDAKKPVEILEATGKPEIQLADATKKLFGAQFGRPKTCIVFANTPKTARATFDRLRKKFKEKDADIKLLTGRMREREAETVRGYIKSGMAATRTEDQQRHLIVVATQTLEVGADVDAEFMVTEACGVRALTQRLGRLNRMGRYEAARGVYIHIPPTGKNANWPVYGLEPKEVLARLQKAEASSEICRNSEETEDGVVVLSPRRVTEVLGEPGDDPGRAPEILYGLLWEWLKTTTPPDGEAPVEPYFAGIEGPRYMVSVVWRAHVPKDGELVWPRVRDQEAVDIPISDFRTALKEDKNICRLKSNRIKVEEKPVEDIRPGDIVLLPTDRGLLDDFGWNESSTKVVVDASIENSGLPLDAEAIRLICGLSLGNLIKTALGKDEDDEVDEEAKNQALTELRSQLREATPTGWQDKEWRDFVDRLGVSVTPRGEVARLPLRATSEKDISDELDERSLSKTAVNLKEHCNAVGTLAGRIARRLGLDAEITTVVETAGRLHDLGKADPRFQRWLRPSGNPNSELMAKSETRSHNWRQERIQSGWPQGGRHEELSARLVKKWLESAQPGYDPADHDLLFHLIVSHHGHGRPLVKPVVDGSQGTLVAPIDGPIQQLLTKTISLGSSQDIFGTPSDERAVEISTDLSSSDWDQPSRFRRLCDRLGPWGLALLEAVVRQADHNVSSGAFTENSEESA